VSRIPKPNFVAILQALVEHHVDFMVVGGVGAVLQGAPIATFDLDIVHSTEPRNVQRLDVALDALDGAPRGCLNLLGVIGHGHGYNELIQKAIAVQSAEAVAVPVLELSALIAAKEETAGEKDRAVLPILRQTLRERQ
jgi:hypothetical protein